MSAKIYTLKSCSTCRKARAWLQSHAVPFEEIAIRETPPTADELEAALASVGGELRRLFNTSGQEYRARNLKDSLPDMSPSDALSMLAGNGNLIKRPFFVSSGLNVVLVGFREDEWAEVLPG